MVKLNKAILKTGFAVWNLQESFKSVHNYKLFWSFHQFILFHFRPCQPCVEHWLHTVIAVKFRPAEFMFLLILKRYRATYEWRTVCSNKFICAQIGPIMIVIWNIKIEKESKWKLTLHNTWLQHCQGLFLIFKHFLSAGSLLETYRTYRCTNNFIGTNCTLLHRPKK